MCYLLLTIGVKLLNLIWLWQSMHDQTKLLDQIWTDQIVATPAINNSKYTTVVDHEENMEQIMVLNLVGGYRLCTQCTLNQNRPQMWSHHVGINDFTVLLSFLFLCIKVSSNSIFIFNITSTLVPTITCCNVGTPAGAISHHMTHAVAAVTN